jgi:hypothetical protein
MERYLEQAKDYVGYPTGWCRRYDSYGEEHFILEMNDCGVTYWLDWIGGEYAEEPDEFDEFCKPFDNMEMNNIPQE